MGVLLTDEWPRLFCSPKPLQKSFSSSAFPEEEEEEEMLRPWGRWERDGGLGIGESCFSVTGERGDLHPYSYKCFKAEEINDTEVHAQSW